MAHPSALDAEGMKGFRIAPHHPAELAAPSVWAPRRSSSRERFLHAVSDQFSGEEREGHSH